jgi:hypothetical protein
MTVLQPCRDNVATDSTIAILPLSRRERRVALNVSGHDAEMLVALHGKRFAPTPVIMAQSRITPVLLPPPAPDMGDRQPLHELRQFTIALLPQQQVQRFGITAYAQIRIGKTSRVSRKTCSNAW